MNFKFWKKKVWVQVSYGKTFNLGNYESERIDLQINQELGDDFLPDLINKQFKYLKIKVHSLQKEDVKIH